ncbi:MAG: hypothetical protein KAH25_10065, partial [Bacteroidales bacterium]|nr:hypothetical protein [Bacteroidales bacterium]
MKKNRIRLSYLVTIILILVYSSVCIAQNRGTQSLNDNWKFTLVDKEIDYINLSSNAWEEVKIPHTWNDQDLQSGKKVHYGTAWYKRDLIIENTKRQQHFLRFEGVGQYAEVYINNKYVGEHLGAFSAFVFNITPFLNKDATNIILVKVNNELADSYPKDSFLFGIYGGLYRGVSLISTNDIHLALSDQASSGVYVHQENVSRKQASLKIVSQLINETSEKQIIKIRHKLLSSDGKTIVENTIEEILFPGGLVPITSYLK